VPLAKFKFTRTQQPSSYSHYTGQPALAGTSSYELEDFVDAKFYCLHALADGNQHSWIREKMLEFSSTVMLCTLRDLSKSSGCLQKQPNQFQGDFQKISRIHF